MDLKTLEKFEKAAKIASEVRNFAIEHLKEGAKILDIANAVEAKIRQLGAKPAFPVNISINEIAAHYTPRFNDETVLKRGDLVKFDFGVHIDGCSADTATPISIGKSEENALLIRAAEEALQAAISKVRPGVKVSEIGAAIAAVAEKYNVQPIRNLTGHGITEWNLHDSPSIPNFDNNSSTKLEADKIIAIEPFMTYGKGMIKEAETCEIYMLAQSGVMRDKEVLDFIKREFNTLPFAKRWLVARFGLLKATNALREGVSKGILYEYKVLKDVSGAKVAQAEHTILVKEKPKILTS
jgi:methionyl aminopeptidase